MSSEPALDLVVLIPGADEREALDELLAHRRASLGIREVHYRLLKHTPRLRPWLTEQGVWPQGAAKPSRPKESLEKALRQARIRRSAAIYRRVAARVGLDRCEDASFLELKRILQAWFPRGL